MCRTQEHTHEVEKDADEPSPVVTVEEVWCRAVRDVVEDSHCDCTEGLFTSSEHRDESKKPKNSHNSVTNPRSVKSSRTSRRVKFQEESSYRDGIKIHWNTLRKTRRVRSRWTNPSQMKDEEQNMEEFVQNALKDQKIAAKKTQSIREELAAASKVGARESEKENIVKDEQHKNQEKGRG